MKTRWTSRLIQSIRMPLFSNFFPPEILAFTSDRSVDFTLKRDRRGFSQDQRDYLTKQCKTGLPDSVNIHQMHGNRICNVSPSRDIKSLVLQEADGLVTDMTNTLLAIRTADCLPVWIYDPQNKCIGLIHAGWRGSHKRITEEAIKTIEKQWQCRPKHLKIGFGPAIRNCCYEVGEDVAALFSDDMLRRDDRLFLDLIGVNKRHLIDIGIKEENMNDCQICTCCHPRYFSYRREGEGAGRMISLMMMKDS